MSIKSRYGKTLTATDRTPYEKGTVTVRMNPEPGGQIGMLSGIFQKAELVAELKAAGLTAEDFREPTFQEEFAKLEDNTVFQMVDPVVASADKPLFLKEDANYMRKIRTGERFDAAPVSRRYGVKVISKPVEN